MAGYLLLSITSAMPWTLTTSLNFKHRSTLTLSSNWMSAAPLLRESKIGLVVSRRVASRRVASHSSVALSITTLPRSARSPLLTFLVSDDSDVNQGTALGLLDDLTEVVLLRLGVEVFYVDGGGVSRELEMARHDEVLRRVKKVRSKLIGLVLV